MLSVEELEVSVGHNCLGLHQFYCKISFRKILNFVKKMSQTLLAIANFTLKSTHFCLICQKNRNFQLFYELL